MDEPGCVIWVTHPSFRTLSEENFSAIVEYFGCEEKSGGRGAKEHQRIKSSDGVTTALLIKFADNKCVQSVLNRPHHLRDIFPTDKFTADQTLEVKEHNFRGGGDQVYSLTETPPPSYAESTMASPGSEEWTLLSTTEKSEGSCGDNEPTNKLEVYEYPEDCVITELTDHFVEQFKAQCRSSEEEIEREFAVNKTFILRFLVPDAEKILEHPEQCLDPDDDDTKIKIRRVPPQNRKVVFHCQGKTNSRMVKKSLKGNDIESCEPASGSQTDIIVTFKYAEDAERFVSGGKLHRVSSTLTASVSYHEDSGDTASVRPKLPLPGIDERPDNPMSGASGSSMSLDMDLTPGSLSPRQPSSVVEKIPSAGTSAMDSKQSSTADAQHPTETSSTQPLSESPREEAYEPYTYIEIEKFSKDIPEDVYEIIRLHMTEIIGKKWSMTKFQQSYDDNKKVFRFDMKHQDVEKLLAAGPQFADEEDDESLLKITRSTKGTVISLSVISNPSKAKLTEKDLRDAFGPTSLLASKLQIAKIDRTKGALVQMETASAAALMVSEAKHQLPNGMVLMASYDLTLRSPDAAERGPAPIKEEPVQQTEKQNKAVMVELEQPISDTMLKKFMKTVKGEATRVDPQKFIINFDDSRDAAHMAMEGQISIGNRRGRVTLYEPPEMAKPAPPAEPTHVEINCSLKETSEDIHALIELHLTEILGEEWRKTKLQHSYDPVKNLYRFDMNPDDIKVLLENKQLIDEEDPSSELNITPKTTGKLVVVKAVSKGKSGQLSKTQLKTYLGPKSELASNVILETFNEQQATVEMETCSAASKLVSARRHRLKNTTQVEIVFPAMEESQSESSDDEEEEAPPQKVEKIKERPASTTRYDQADSGSPNRSATKSHRQGRNSSQSSQAAAGLSMEKELETLLISNLLDVDEQTLSYWVKSVTGLWPISIQLSENEEKAVVKIPKVQRGTDFRQIQRKLTDKNLHIHGERLKLEQVKASNEIQVTVSSPSSDSVHPDIVSGYFSNPRNTGVNSAIDIVVNNHPSRKDTFIISYQTPQDVRVVLNRKPHRAAGYDFDVAEYYEGIGLSKSGSLTLFSYPTGTMNEDEPIRTSLNIFDVRKSDIDTIELLMAAKTRTKGGPIKSFIKINQSTRGVYKVNIVYEEDLVAERVYDYHRRKPISCNGSELKIELESPTLQEYHDKQSVRISGLTPDLDPEKLKFYISALADNLVTQMCFDGTQTKAVATLSQQLDYATTLYHHNKIGLEGCSELKLRQEEKPSHLLAVGKLTKDDIELTLEAYLQKVTGDSDLEVMAELFENTTDKWKIDTGHEALYKADLQLIKNKLPECNQLMVYSEHLGLNMTTGTYKKTKELSELVSDQRMLDFLLLTKLPGHDALVKHLQGHGFTMKPNGSITVNIGTDKKNNRRNLHNWRSLNQCIEKFTRANCLIYETEQLTEQVYSHMVKNMQDLTKKLSVALYLVNDGQPSAVNTISVVGEKSTIENLKQKMLSQIKAKEKLIQDERSTKPVVVPNIMEYQLEYLDNIDFFKDMKVAHKLKDIQFDLQNQNVTITGLPSAIDQVQKQMLDLLPKVAKSKCSESKKPLFLKVFTSKLGKESLYNEFKNRRVMAVWTIENKTVSMYSETKELARVAMDCLNDVIWEAQYPVGRDFDDLEKQLLTTQGWRNKKDELEHVAEPLQIVQYGDRPALSLVGLKYKKGHVLEEIPAFFETNVIRQDSFQGKGRRISYLYTYRPQKFTELAKEFFVELKRESNTEAIDIHGTRNSIANAKRAIQSLHQTINKDEYTVDCPAMVQHIKNDRDLLEHVGMKRKCLITIHEEESEDFDEPGIAPQTAATGGAFTAYRIQLPSGAICVVKRGDITQLACDAVVNPANGDLDHCGGLAYAIVQAGGDSIQQDCKFYTRQNGRLMDGQVMSTTGGRLRCKYVIHAVGPRWNGGGNEEEWHLSNCIENCFEELMRLNKTSIAIPPISTGIFGFPLERAVKTIVETIHEVEKRGELPREIILIDNKDDSLRCFERELRSRFKAAVPSRQIPAPAPRRSNPQSTGPAVAKSSGSYLINGKTIYIQNKVNLEIVSGDITNRQEESLVNSVGSDMNLGNGMVAPIIAQKAGPQLQQACSALAPISAGEVKATDGYNMPCQKILHCCCPPWNGPASAQALAVIVKECLDLASGQNHSSIAFPALGTGNLNYPEQNVAKCMIEAVIEYIEKNPQSSVTEVKIVVFHRDKKTQTGFDAILSSMGVTGQGSAQMTRNLAPKQQTGTAGSAQRPRVDNANVVGGIQVNNTYLRLVRGSIAEHHADIIVNSTDQDLTMLGQVAVALLAKAGGSVKREVEHLARKKSKNGIWVSGAGNLSAKHIIHLDSQKPGKNNDKWVKAISTCLAECDQREASSIAFPALATGTIGLPPQVMSKIILEAVNKFLSKNMSTMLRNIDIVIFQPDMVVNFEQAMKSAVKDKSGGLLSRMSQWVASGLNYVFGGNGGSPASAAGRGPQIGRSSAGGAMSEDVMLLDIYGSDTSDIEECKRELERKLEKAVTTMIWSDKPTYSDDKELIMKLQEDRINWLVQQGNEMRVRVKIEKRLHNIKITGLPKDVAAMSDLVTRELKNIDKRIHEESVEEMLSRTISWEYNQSGSTWTKFDQGINKQLEDKYQKNPNANHRYETEDDDQVTIDMSKMLGHDQGGQFEVRRTDHSKPKVLGVDLPKTWTGKLDMYSEDQVTPGSAEYIEVEQNFRRTIGAAGLQQVLEVRRVQNPTLYQQYAILRKDVAKKLNKKESDVETVPLWHGTDSATVSKITAGKFDRGLAGKNATMYGVGSYFARDSAYSFNYAQPDPNNGDRYMIQTRVLTGEWAQGAQGIKTAPYKNNSPTLQYDSVVDNMASPGIYVVFNDASAYPEYIIKFR